MNEQQRQTNFIREYRLLCQRWGIQLQAEIHPQMVGTTQIGVQPVLQPVLDPEWQMPEQSAAVDLAAEETTEQPADAHPAEPAQNPHPVKPTRQEKRQARRDKAAAAKSNGHSVEAVMPPRRTPL